MTVIERGNYDFVSNDWIRLESIINDMSSRILSLQIATIGTITPTDGTFIVGSGTNWVGESGATVRTSLGLGTGDSPEFTGLKLTGLSGLLRATAGVIDVITHNTTNLKIVTSELNTVQDIAVTSSPTFVGLTLTGLLTNTPVATDTQGLLVQGADFTFANIDYNFCNIQRSFIGSGSYKPTSLSSILRIAGVWNYDYAGGRVLGTTVFRTVAFTNYLDGSIAPTIADGFSATGSWTFYGVDGQCNLNEGVIDSTTRGVKLVEFVGGRFSSAHGGTLTQFTNAMEVSFVGGEFGTALDGSRVITGNPTVNYIGGRFIAVGGTDGTSVAKGGLFKASGADTNWAIFNDLGNVFLGDDSEKTYWGTGLDLQLYHDGTNSYIYNDTGILKIQDAGSGINLGTTTAELLGFYGVTCVNQPDTIADPTGGLVTDAEARTAINTIIDRLQELGLIA